MKKIFVLCLVMLFLFGACKPKWEFVEESVLKSAVYNKGSFSVSPYWTIIFENRTVVMVDANEHQALFIGKVYEIYHRKGTSWYSEGYDIVLKKGRG